MPKHMALRMAADAWAVPGEDCQCRPILHVAFIPSGMRGGLISVGGSAGDRVAERMRRGIIVIDGAVGAYAAGFMVAGTLAAGVAAGGGRGPHPGFGMRRGTRDWLFLHLLRRALEGTGSWLERAHTTRAHRFIGDLAEGGHGEILAMA